MNLSQILVILVNLCYVVSCPGHIEILAGTLSGISELNADFILVADSKWTECIQFEKVLRVQLPGSLLMCLPSENQKFRVSPLQSQQVGIIFIGTAKVNASLLQKITKMLDSYRRQNPFALVTTSDQLNSTEFILESPFVIEENIYILNCNNKRLFEAFTRKNSLVISRIMKTIGGFFSVTDKVRRRANLMGSDIVATTVNEKSYQNWVNLSSSNELISGFSVSIYKDLKYMLNFTERVVIGDWIENDAEGRLRGKTYNQISSSEADISITQQSLLSYRAKYLKFLQPTYQGLLNAFFHQPETSAIRNIVTAPFKTTLWLCLFLTWFCVIATVRCLLRFRNYSDLDNSSTDSRFSRDVLMWAIAATCQKSWYKPPTCTSIKMTFLIGYIVGVVCYVAYSAAIVSTLAVAIVPIKEFVDLTSFKYVFTVHKMSRSTAFYLELLINATKLKQKVETVTNENEVSHLLHVNPRYAFLSSDDNFYLTASENYSKHYMCTNINSVPVTNVPTKTGMFMRKGSEMAELFNYKIMVLKERGLNLRYMQNYNKLTSLQCDSRDKLQGLDDPGLGLEDIFTAFLIIIIGSGLAFIIVIMEVLNSRNKLNSSHHW